MSLAKNALVTIGIPTLGREDVLLDTIKMVLDQEYPAYEVIVADQTTNHTAEFLNDVNALSKNDKRLHYFLIKPQNLPAARNFIVSKANSNLVLFIDDDVVLKPDFITRHAQAHTAHPQAAIVAGRIEQKGLPLSKEPLFFDDFGLPQGTFNCPVSAFCSTFPGGNHSVRKEAIENVGGYCTAFKKSAVREESDAAYRLTRAGYEIYYSSDASLIHLSDSSGGTRISKAQFDDFGFYINDLLFMWRTVRLRNLPKSIFRRLRIYSGGSGLLSWRRLKRSTLFVAGLMWALLLNVFAKKASQAKVIKEVSK